MEFLLNFRKNSICLLYLINNLAYIFLNSYLFYRKHVLKACNSNDPYLKATGIMSLIKFMMISNSFCHKHLPVWFFFLLNKL